MKPILIRSSLQTFINCNSQSLLGFIKVKCVSFKLDAGKKEMEKEILMLEEQFPSAAKGVAEFSTPLAHQIIAGTSSDLLQARLHPCQFLYVPSCDQLGCQSACLCNGLSCLVNFGAACSAQPLTAAGPHCKI